MPHVFEIADRFHGNGSTAGAKAEGTAPAR
jgi:hypothetical protein